MPKLRGRLYIVLFCTILFIINGELLSQAGYNLRVANCILINTNTIEFDVYIKSTGSEFILTSYQCALSFNQSVANSGDLSFLYISGSSQLASLPPVSAVGIIEHNELKFLTFCSMPPPAQETISSLEKRIGKFRLTSSRPFTSNITNIIWGLTEPANTLLTGTGYTNITNKANHISLSGTSGFQFSTLVGNDWNLVSIPGYHPFDQNINTWWASRDPFTNVYNSNYQSVTNLEPGKGYWLKHSGSLVYNTGEEWPSEGIIYSPNYPITGRFGWNLIGIYNYSFPVSEIKTIPQGLQAGMVFKFVPTGGYQPVSNLIPGYGYLVFLTGPGKIILPDSGYVSAFKISSKQSDDWGEIIITDNKNRSYSLYSIEDGTDPQEFLLPPVLNDEIFDIRFGSGKFAEDISRGIHTIEMRGIEYPVKVRINNTSVKLQDETGTRVNSLLKTGDEVIIESAINKLLISKNAIPGEYSLEQNYPNPFNPSTTIEFSLPEEVSNVRLTIFNSLGQEVTELVNSQLLPGYYSYKWESGDAASGLYIYELRVESPKGGFISSKKMILLH